MGRTAAGRQQVVLLDAPEQPGARSRRRVRPWWVVVPVAAVAVLLVAQGVVDGRERAAVARLDDVPGVVGPVAAQVGVRWAPGAGADSLFSSGFAADGAVVGLVHGSDGSQQVVAFDARTGAHRWSTQVLAADPNAVLTERGVPVGGCQRQGAEAVCLATDSYVEYGNDPPELVLGDRSDIVRVTLRDGDVPATRAAPGVTSFAVLPGLVVTGAPTSAGGLVVVGTDAQTGAARWTHREPAVAGKARGLVLPAAGGVAVWMPPGLVTLLDPAGAVLRAHADARVRYTVEPASGIVIASSTDASGDRVSSDVRAGAAVTLPGTRIELAVDDGSVPGLALTSGRTLDAYDRDTGRLRWTLPRSAFGDALVLLGRVYVLTSDGVLAVDGSSGAELWRAPAVDGAILRTLVTDGHHVLAAEHRDSGTELVAFDPESGHEAWRTALPDQIDTVASAGRLLIGFTRGTPAVLG